MRLKTTYIILCIFGLLLPYSQFVPWLLQHGPNIRLFVEQLFSNRVSTFFAVDVLMSAVVLIVFMRSENPRFSTRQKWLPIIALLTVGVSLAFPRFLYLRELKPEDRGAP
jgi:hypothetical protein